MDSQTCIMAVTLIEINVPGPSIHDIGIDIGILCYGISIAIRAAKVNT